MAEGVIRNTKAAMETIKRGLPGALSLKAASSVYLALNNDW
jgi:hypothetical protein